MIIVVIKVIFVIEPGSDVFVGLEVIVVEMVVVSVNVNIGGCNTQLQ